VTNTAGSETGIIRVLWSLIAIYAIARVLQLFPVRIPMPVIVALHVLPPTVFALIHGAMFYRVRGILIFLAICFVIGNVSENLGIRTGFPFGRYYFTDLMGPKLFSVPILLGLAYLGMGYLSWTLARTILGGMRSPLAGFRVVTVPVVAGFIMVAWDFSMDPIWSTIEHAWIWMDGGAYFGVPASNFLGWYLTVYLMCQLFALHLRASATTPVRNAATLSPVFWYLPVIFYGISAAGNILLAIPSASPWVVADPTGALWRVRDITHTCALVSFFLMGGFALFALARIPRQNADAHSPVYQEKRSRAK